MNANEILIVLAGVMMVSGAVYVGVILIREVIGQWREK
jgi:hypothetical protein